MNILDNAIDAISCIEPDSEKIIRISTGLKQIDHIQSVSIRFENSGPAIPDDQIRKIFDPFFTTKDPGKGVGLGMSISYNIIREHKGNLSVYNKDNRVVFEVILPVNGD